MKRAEDWLDAWDNETKWTRLSLIEAIQRDALLHAVEVSQEDRWFTLDCQARPYYDVCAYRRAIKAEADKLKP